jgi:hypothetical protein
MLRGNVPRLGRIRIEVVEFDRARLLVGRGRTRVEVGPDRLPVADPHTLLAGGFAMDASRAVIEAAQKLIDSIPTDRFGG